MNIVLAGGAVVYKPNDDELGRVSLEFAAFDGEVGAGQLPIPDPTAILTVAGGRQAMVEEGATLVTDGFIIDHDRERGPMPAATAREYTFGVVDANALLGGFRVTRSRPAETDYARVMAFAAIDGPSWDTTMVINASTVTMPAKKYDTAGGWDELITDTVEFTGKTLWLHDFADGSGRCLHYHLLTNGHTCGLTISDVAGAEDLVTVFAPQSPARTRTSVDLVNDVKGRDQSGRTSLAQDIPSITAHDADGLQHQALVDFETTGQADLNVKTAAFLASYKDEQDTWTCAIGPLDEDALALIRVGDLITTTSTVMGLTASVRRIAHMTLTVFVGENGRARPGLWVATLELGAPIRRRARVKVGPSLAAAVAPHLPTTFVQTCDLTLMQDTFTRTVATGSLGTSEFTGFPAWSGLFSTAYQSVNGDEAVLDPLDSSVVAATTTAAAVTLTTLDYPFRMRVKFRVMGPDPGSFFFSLGTGAFGSFPAGSGNLVVTIDYNTVGLTDPIRMTATQTSGAGGSAGAAVYPIGAVDPAGTYLWVDIVLTTTGFDIRCWVDGGPAPGFTSYVMTPAGPMVGTPNILTIGAGTQVVPTGEQPDWRVTLIQFMDCSLPIRGQTVREVVGTGDGATTGFTTTYPYVAGSLEVEVSGGLAEHDIAETDPATGDFDFGSAPFDTEVVYAEYQAA